MEHKIIVAGIGPGNPAYMVPEARRVIESARVLAGGRRALSQFAGENVQEQCVIGADIPAVMAFIRKNLQHDDVVVMVSGAGQGAEEAKGFPAGAGKDGGCEPVCAPGWSQGDYR